MSFLFISHQSSDDEYVNDLVTRLNDESIETWVDHINGISPSDDVDLEIQQALNACEHGLVVYSNNTFKSPEVRNEIRYLLNEGKRVYVARIEEIQPGKFHWRLSTIAYVDLFKNPATFDTLIDAIKKKRNLNLAHDTVSIERRLTFTRAMDPRLFVEFIGREDDVAAINVKLKSPYPVFITGIGGLGKSRLAYEVALGVSGEDGAVWHECTDVSSTDDILLLLKSHLGFPLDADAYLVLRLAQERKLLVAIDNAESISDNRRRIEFVEFANQLSQGGASVLFTSREMWPEMPRAQEHTPAGLPLRLATKICLAMCDAEDVALNAAQAQTLAEKARQHPRLIELAVTMCKTRDFERVITSLNGLKGRRVEDALAEMFTRSLEQAKASDVKYGPMAAASLLRLNLCRGGFTYDAAQALCIDQSSDALPQSDDDLDEALDLLQQWKFVSRDHKTQRYRISMLIVDAIGEENRANELHTMYYGSLAKMHVVMSGFNHLVPELDNLRIAFERLLAADATKPAFRMYLDCSEFLANRLLFNELQRWYYLLLPKVNEGDSNNHKSYMNVLAAQLLRHLNYGDKVLSLKASIKAIDAALSYFPPNTVPVIRASILHDKAITYAALAEREHPVENLNVAIHLFEQAIASYEGWDDFAPNYVVYNNLGLACARLARTENYDNVIKARSAFGKALQLTDKRGAEKEHATVLMNIGDLLMDVATTVGHYDDFDLAMETFELAAKYLTADEEPFRYARLRIKIGDVFQRVSTYLDQPEAIDKFFEAYNEALRFYSIQVEPEFRGNILAVMGTTFLFWDNLEMAIRRWQEAKECFELVGDTSHVERLSDAIENLRSAQTSML